MKYKLLAVDMDGTVLNSQKKISPRTKSALDELMRRSVYVVVSTGRNLAELTDYRDDFKAMNYGIVISGGMIPKIDCCVEAVRRGVSRANIIDGRIPHSILIELLSDEGSGTMIF